MIESEFSDSNFTRYLRLLNLKQQYPDIDYLQQLVRAHLSAIPFENISKIYYLVTQQQNSLSSFNQFLSGIEEYHFGGTCYINNYYFFMLLTWLGFDARLCGADMDTPDAHIVIIVTINDKELLVDTGYAAPFHIPIPCDSKDDYIIQTGEHKYVLKPREQSGWQQLIFYKNENQFHGYYINPAKKTIKDFSESIIKSYMPEATFMNSILCTILKNNMFYRIQNLEFIKFILKEKTKQEKSIISHDELATQMHSLLLIPEYICRIAVEKAFKQN